MFSIQISGLDELKNAFMQASDDLAAQVQQTVTDTAENIVDAAKQNCPVKTGKLRDSISAEISDDGMSAIITADVPYAAYVEYGPYGKPFLNPAFEEQSPQLTDSLNDIIG